MLIDGEKYACEACVRGHRVSTCQHSDRPLTHINKKGRPVSQCPHCRGLRKARAAHVACECGSKPHSKDDCGENDSRSDLSEAPSDSKSDPGTERPPLPFQKYAQRIPQPQAAPPPSSAVQQRGCCCSHGSRCTCALKKEPLDPVPEIEPPFLPRKRAATLGGKPRLMKTGSDNALTVFTNGHHKPTHKHNDSAHQSGLPYKIPIPHSVSGNADIARRSADSLPLLKRREEAAATQLQEAIPSTQPDFRLSKSEHGSPEPNINLFRDVTSPLHPLDLTYPSLTANSLPYPDEYSHSPHPQEVYYEPQEEPPLLSAGRGGTTDWSDLNLPLNSATYSSSFDPHSPYLTIDPNGVGSHPLPTGSSSGDVSETASDYISHSGQPNSPIRPDLTSASSADSQSLNRLSTSSFASMPQTSIGGGKSDVPATADAEFHPSTASPIEFEDPNALHPDAFERHGFTVHDAQKLAHPEQPLKFMGDLPLPFPGSDIDQLIWGTPTDPTPGPFVSQAMVEGMSAGLVGPTWQ